MVKIIFVRIVYFMSFLEDENREVSKGSFNLNPWKVEVWCFSSVNKKGVRTQDPTFGGPLQVSLWRILDPNIKRLKVVNNRQAVSPGLVRTVYFYDLKMVFFGIAVQEKDSRRVLVILVELILLFIKLIIVMFDVTVYYFLSPVCRQTIGNKGTLVVSGSSLYSTSLYVGVKVNEERVIVKVDKFLFSLS